jgi:hypothetical protein
MRSLNVPVVPVAEDPREGPVVQEARVGQAAPADPVDVFPEVRPEETEETMTKSRPRDSDHRRLVHALISCRQKCDLEIGW